MNRFHSGDLKQLAELFKIIVVYVDSRGEIICDFNKYGGSKEQLAEYLGISINFTGIKNQVSQEAAIKIVPIYPGKQLPDDMESYDMALLTFDQNDQTPCPKVLKLFSFQSFTGKIQSGLSSYNIDSILGHGAFGIVSRVQEKTTGEWYAMKTISIEQYIKKNQNYFSVETARTKIALEIQIQEKIKSPYVIQVKETFEENENIYIVMELALKMDLQLFIQNRKEILPIKELQRIFQQICYAVKATHDIGVIHRDIKPENIVLCENDVFKLTDFGLAREGADASSILGTPLYIAPEIIENKRYSNAADIFSLGCIVYFMMTQNTAFKQKAGGFTETIKGIVEDEPDPIQKGIYPLKLIKLCYQMLEKDPNLRPSIDEVLGVLENLDAQEKNDEAQTQQIQAKDTISKPIHIENSYEQIAQKLKGLFTTTKQVGNKLASFISSITQQIQKENIFSYNDNIIDTQIFSEICDIIILSYVSYNYDIQQIKEQILSLKDNYQTIIRDNITIFGDTIEDHQFLFQKRIYKKEFAGQIQNTIEIGAYNDNDLTGFCKKICANGDMILSEFKFSQRDGNGKTIYANKDIFQGQYQNDKRNGYGRFQSISDQWYEGEYKDDKEWNGSGLLHFKNGERYDGQFQNGLKHGLGKYYSANKDIYEGHFTNGKRQGKGKIIYGNGGQFEGEYMDDKEWNGSGLLHFKNGERYDGQFQNGLKHGLGKYYSANKDIYEGHFTNGKRQGKGKIIYGNGGWFEGEFKDDKEWNGNGLLHFSNGDKYEGEYFNGKQNGSGLLIYRNGDEYKGSFKEGIKYGEGIYIYANGDKFDGIFNNESAKGKFTCGNDWLEGSLINIFNRQFQGILHYSNGDVFDGNILNGNRVGFGKHLFANGNIYQGEFNNNSMNGKGTFYFHDQQLQYNLEIINMPDSFLQQWCAGDIYDGNMQNDKFEGLGIAKFGNGCVYEGQFSNSIIQGQGKIIYTNGDIFEGIITNGKKQYGYQQSVGNIIFGPWKNNISVYKQAQYQKKQFEQLINVASMMEDEQFYFLAPFIKKLLLQIENKTKISKLMNGIDVQSFQQLCHVIIMNSIYEQQNVSFIMNEIQYLFENYQFVKYYENQVFGIIDQNRSKIYQKRVYLDGSISIGTYQNNDANGILIQLNSNNAVFSICYYANGQRNGMGMIKYFDGCQYIGQFVDDLISGFGSYMFQNSDTYFGEFLCNQFSGLGVIECTNGDNYQGEFDSNKQNTFGLLKYRDKQCTLGENGLYTLSKSINIFSYCQYTIDTYFDFKNLIQTAKDVKQQLLCYIQKCFYLSVKKCQEKGYKYIDGICFLEIVGVLIIDQMFQRKTIDNIKEAISRLSAQITIDDQTDHWVVQYGQDGYAKQEKIQKDTQSTRHASVIRDLTRQAKGLSGFCQVTFLDGRVEHCQYDCDKKSGFGVVSLPNGDTYGGQFKDDKRCGYGELTTAGDAYYKGEWAGDKKCGSGTMRWAKQCAFQGKWKDDDYYEGVLTMESGETFEGYNLQSVNGTRNGIYKYLNGDIYFGQMKNEEKIVNFKRYGKGMLIKKTGEVQEGVWIDNKLIK